MLEIRGNHSGYISNGLIRFSGGELQPKISDGIEKNSELTIKAVLTSSDDIMELALIVDAIRKITYKKTPIYLECPYLPYARQDRVCAHGESLALKVVCSIINSLEFEQVTVWDVHSDVSIALLNNVKNIPQHLFYADVVHENMVLVSPDAGAIKKTLEGSKHFKLPMVRADKVRSVEDGSITGTTVYSDHIGDKDFLIVDDICDGGRTFIELAKVLRPLTNGKIYLYVTHGIFSKGIDVFNGLIDRVYTPNPFPSVDSSHRLLRII